jgi:hypothetical protein
MRKEKLPSLFFEMPPIEVSGRELLEMQWVFMLP